MELSSLLCAVTSERTTASSQLDNPWHSYSDLTHQHNISFTLNSILHYILLQTQVLYMELTECIDKPMFRSSPQHRMHHVLMEILTKYIYKQTFLHLYTKYFTIPYQILMLKLVEKYT